MNAHIQIVGWNHKQYLKSCIESCLAQTVKLPILYIDNASRDGSAAFVQDQFPDVKVIKNTTNRGYAGGHNDGLRECRESEVAFLLNPDVVLDPELISECLKAFIDPSDPKVGAVAPLLLRPGEGGKEKTVDAFGIKLLPSLLTAVHHYEDKLVSELIHHHATPTPPWGFTGAAVALKREAIDDIAMDGEVFDEDLFSYREDVDLSWRLRHRGWRIVGCATATATHVRAVKKSGPRPSTRIQQLSWRNLYLVFIKNAPASLIARRFILVALEDVLRVLQLLVTPSIWPALPELFRYLPTFLRKRRKVLARRSGVGVLNIG